MLGKKVRFGVQKNPSEIVKIKPALQKGGKDIYVFKGPRGSTFQAIKNEKGRFKRI